MMTLGTWYLTDKSWCGAPEWGTLGEKRVLCAWNGELTVRGTEEIMWMKGRQHLYINTGPACIENTHMFLLLLPVAPATLLVGSEGRDRGKHRHDPRSQEGSRGAWPQAWSPLLVASSPLFHIPALSQPPLCSRPPGSDPDCSLLGAG